MKQQAKNPPLLPPAEPLPSIDRIEGACKERERTLAILDSFLTAGGVPDRDKTLVKLIRDRITGRSVVDVVRDKRPVVQHPTATPGPKKGRAA